MINKRAGILLCSLFLALIVASALGISTSGSKGSFKVQGGVSSVPDTFQFFNDSVPIGILRVTANAKPGKPYKAEEVIVENRTDKNVTEVTFRWSLTTMEDRKTILRQGLMEPIHLPSVKKQLPAKKRQTLKIAVLSLKEMLQDVPNALPLSGNYMVKIGVKAVAFADGSTWREGRTSGTSPGSPQWKTEFLKTAYAIPQATPTISCNKTLCKIQLDSNGDATGLLVCEPDDHPEVSRQQCFYIGDACHSETCQSTNLIDRDNDLYDSTVDCDDEDYYRNPGVTENCHDSVDNDCDLLNNCADSNCSLDPSCQPPGPPCPPCPSDAGYSSWNAEVCDPGESHWSCTKCICVTNPSPILIDTLGDGFALTDAAGGVNFDLDGTGPAERLAWTAVRSDDAWLALDRDGNGTIDNGQELFGNFTPQSVPPANVGRNGFLALAEYDKAANGGNGDGVIDTGDAIFSSLRLWQDVNHNGISETGELQPLPSRGVAKLALNYKESKRVDQYGNRFKYRAKVEDGRGAQVGRWAWDVFLVSAP